MVWDLGRPTAGTGYVVVYLTRATVSHEPVSTEFITHIYGALTFQEGLAMSDERGRFLKMQPV